MRPAAFTLVELLVVITIIVILLALLAPAMDKAVYQSQLAVCGANLKGLGTSVGTYAMDHARAYPYRAFAGTANRAMKLNGGNQPTDLRRVIRGYVPINKLLVDPLCARIELETDQSAGEQVFASYSMWFGWRIGAFQGMNRLGDRMVFEDQSFSVLVSDLDDQRFSNWAQASHPDEAGAMLLDTRKYKAAEAGGMDLGVPGLAMTYSIWVRTGSHKRGRLDYNVGFADGSVRRHNEVLSHEPGEPDDRFVALPSSSNRENEQIIKAYLPKND